MLSYHLRKPDAATPNAYWRDFKSAEVDDVGRLSRAVVGYVWSPITWRDGVRRQDHFRAVNWCVLDFDDGEMTLADASNLFCDMVHFIGTTKSHQKDKGGRTCDRFRVAMRFEKTITSLRIYRWNMHQILDRYPCDKACKDGARFFYPCQAVTQLEGDGYHVEVDEAVPDWFDQPRTYAGHKAAGIIPAWAAATLESVIPTSQRNTTIYQLAKDLAKVGMEEDEIVQRIVQSPTYGGQAAGTLLQEIRKAVRSGHRKASVEIGRHTDERRDAGDATGGDDAQGGEHHGR